MYQPLNKTQYPMARLALAAVLSVLLMQSAAGNSLLEKLGIGSTSNSQQDFLPAEEAFALNVSRLSEQNFLAQWNIEKDYYLYRDKIKVVIDGQTLALSKPPGQMIKDPTFGEVPIYRTQSDVTFKANPHQEVHITWQGCADAGLCYSPVTQIFSLMDAHAAESPQSMGTPVAEQERLADFLGDSSLLFSMLAFLGFGLLLAFTPCVLPMVPILSSIITSSESARGSSTKAFYLSLSYVLAMALTYSIAGVLIASSGSGFQLWFQHPVVISAAAAIFVLLALSMFGYYNLQLPASWSAKLSLVGQGQRGSLSGAAVMGVFSALVVSPCVTPPLIGALLFVARTGDAVAGGLTLFSLAIGMGLPLLVIGTSLGRFMPRPGPGLDVVKNIAGFIMIGFAIWLLGRTASTSAVILLSGVLIAVVGIYIIRRLDEWSQGKGMRALLKVIALLIFAYGSLLTLHAANGGMQWSQPWHIASHTSQSPVEQASDQGLPVPFPAVYSLDAVEQQLQANAQANLPTVMLVSAAWCSTCEELKKDTFSDPTVRKTLMKIKTVGADITDTGDASKKILSAYGLFGPPAIMFFDAQGQEIKTARLVGMITPEDFIAHLKKTLGNRYF